MNTFLLLTGYYPNSSFSLFDMETILAYLSLLILPLFVAMAISLVMIVVQGYPLYVLAKNKGMQYPWLAFIPVAQIYVICMLVDKPFETFIDKFRFENRMHSFIAYLIVIYGGSTICGIISSILSIIPILGMILSFVPFVAKCIILYVWYKDLYETYSLSDKKDTNTLMAILSIFVPFCFLITLWIIKDHQPVYYTNNNNNYKPEL